MFVVALVPFKAHC